MDTENISINIERVDNGWVVRGWGQQYARHEGYMPAGTMVARSPDQLAQIVIEWASRQKDRAQG
jgi:hypothetical protein